MAKRTSRRLANLFNRFAPKDDQGTLLSESELEACLSCGADLANSREYQRYRVCHRCQFHYSLSARERIDLFADQGSFSEINRSLFSLDPLSFSGGASYRKKLFEAQKITHLTEAVVTGTCEINGNPIVVFAMDFGFLGGSMGCVVGEKITLAFEHAQKKRYPLIGIITSGGARIQEGVLSLMQMAKTTAAVKRFQKSGLPCIAVLANPTTGQVYASFTNLADIILAEPGALVGFAPLREVKEASTVPLPKGAHTADSHLKHGLIDQVVPRPQLNSAVRLLLDLLTPQYELSFRGKTKKRERVFATTESAWEQVRLARHQDRPTSVDYIGRIIDNFVELHGDRAGGDDPALVCGVGYLRGEAVMVIGQERGHGSDKARLREGRISPAGLRKAQRIMDMAARFKLPLVIFVDTPGALPSLESEEQGLGYAVASTMAKLSDLPTPVISVIIGEGGSEGALALGVADRILMLNNAIYSPISPEGAATLLYQDPGKAEEVAPALKLTARDCHQLGIIDSIVQEPNGGAHLYPDETARQVQRILVRELLEIQSTPVKKLLEERQKKFRSMGEYNSQFRAAFSIGVNQWRSRVARRLTRLRDRFAGKKRNSDSTQEDSLVNPNRPTGV